jgi:O-antigen/teichoic acid export membrane protein
MTGLPQVPELPAEAPGSVPTELGAGRATSGLLAVDRSLRLQSLFVTLARALRTLFAIAVPIVLVRVLDQTTFGQYKQIGLLTGTAVAVLTLGIPGSLYYFVPRTPRASQSLIVRSGLLLAVLGVTGGLVVAGAASWLGGLFSAPLPSYRILLALIVAISVPEALTEVVAVVDRRARLAVAAVGVLEALRSALVVGAALWTGDLFFVLVALVAGISLRLLALVGYLAWRRMAHRDERERFHTREQLRYSLPFFGAALVGMARDQFHSYFMVTQYAAAQFAIYAIGTMPIPFVDKLTQSVAEVVVIDASKNFGLGRQEEIRRVWWRASYAIALVLVPVFMILQFFATDVISLLYGADYAAAAPLMRVYLCLILLWIPLSSAMLRASASPRTMLVADTLSLLATVATLLAAAAPLGPLGAVLSLVVGNLVFNVVAGFTVAGQLGIGLRDFLPWQRIAGLFAMSAGCSAVAALATSPLVSWLRAFAGPGLAGGLILLVLWLSPLLPESERATLRRAASVASSALRRALTRTRDEARG